MKATLALVLACIGSTAALADAPTIRMAAHAGYGRVVFAFPTPTTFTLEQAGDLATLHFDQPGDVPGAGGTRNLRAIRGGPGWAELALAPGARIRVMRMDTRVVVDVLDPPKAAPAVAKPKPDAGQVLRLPAKPAPAALVAPLAGPAAPAAAVQSAAPVPVMQQPLEAPAQVAPAAAEVMAVSATPAPLPAGVAGTGALVPFSRRVGAAAFRRADGDYVVFDERRPIDLQALHDDPAFASATIQLLPAATLLRTDPAPGVQLRLTRQADGWLVASGPVKPTADPIEPDCKDGRMTLPVAKPGHVVVVPDTATGEDLLVGTVLDAGAGVAVARRLPEFTLAATWQGVVVEPHTDRVAMRATAQGFVIDAAGQPLAVSAQPDAARLLSDAAVLTRRFDFPHEPADVLLRRMQDEVAGAGAAPPQARFHPRLAAAQSMISLGLDAEALALLHLAAKEEPRLASDPDLAGLSAIAALLAGRPEEAAGLSDPALSGTDEIALWRAAADAMRDETSASAPVFAATLPLVLAYPAALRNRLLPLAVEAMAQGGAGELADAVLAKLPDEPLLASARATRLAAQGNTDQALSVFDTLATGRDRLAAVRAAAQAIELRLAKGAVSGPAAADALEQQFLAWRGDGRELALRLRVAGLRADPGGDKPGNPRAALALLRETEAIYPDAHPVLRARMGEILTAAMTQPAADTGSPLDIVTLAEENTDVAAEGLPADTAALLADKLLALDLPKRAGPLLETLSQRAAPGDARAEIGLRLAKLRLGEGDGDGALAALEQSAAPGLSVPLTDARTITAARAEARRGDPRHGMALLADAVGAEADQTRADLLAGLGDWLGAATAMAAYVEKAVPAEGALSNADQDALLRLASLQSQAGDGAGLRALGAREAARMATGPQHALFAVLTAIPVRETTDLKRSASEVTMARAIPANLAVISGR